MPVSWADVNEAHAALHAAIVDAAASPRITEAHRALSGELRLFLLQLEPLWSARRLSTDHAALVAGLEHSGPEVLREHLRESAAALAAPQNETGRPRHFPGTPARSRGGE